MTEWLSRTSGHGRKRTLWIVLTLNVAIATGFFVTGGIGDSSALIANGLDNTSDSLVYAISLFALYRSARWKRGAANLSVVRLRPGARYAFDVFASRCAAIMEQRAEAYSMMGGETELARQQEERRARQLAEIADRAVAKASGKPTPSARTPDAAEAHIRAAAFAL